MTTAANAISITAANEVTIILAAKTNYVMNWPKVLSEIDVAEAVQKQVDAAAKKTYPRLLTAHQADYQSLFNRVTLDLPSTIDQKKMSTLERLLAYRKDCKSDHGLEALLFHYGRYLLISCSRKGGSAANLQGLWNHSKNPAWQSDYHTDINIQMNYWLSGPTALAECFEPFANYANFLKGVGKAAAKKYFGAKGFYVSIYSNVWGYAEPRWIWPGAGGWLAQNMYDQFLFTGDETYLRTQAYPYMKGSCEFLLDLLVPYKGGKLVIAPMLSPENFIKKDGIRYRGSAGTAVDQQIVHDLFTNTIEAAELLEVDKALVKTLKDRLARLSPPVKIRKNGLIQEWIEDWPSSMPHHRHVSHLYALYPGRMFKQNEHPDWKAAAAKSLEIRSKEKTEWTTAWAMNLWARLGKAKEAQEQLSHILVRRRTTGTKYPNHSGVYDNLLTTHCPLVIDGNLGTTAGMAEMLLQSHEGNWQKGHQIHLLPALPGAWPDGAVKGLRARGGFIIDMQWKDDKLISGRIHSLNGRPATVFLGGKATRLTLDRGTSVMLDAKWQLSLKPFFEKSSK